MRGLLDFQSVISLAELARDFELEAQRQLEEQHLTDLQRQREDAERLQAEASGLLDQYIRLIVNRIEQNWIRPASAQPGLECEVRVIQIPSGDIVDVRIGRCNGDDAVIRSIEAAVRRITQGSRSIRSQPSRTMRRKT